MSQLPYLDFSPFADEDWQGWEKGPNGAQLKMLNESGNYYLRFENPQGHITGRILSKTVSGFIPGNLYRFSVDFRRNMEQDYWRPVVELAVAGIGRAPDQAIVEPHWVTFSFDFVATDSTHRLDIATFDRAPDANACSPETATSSAPPDAVSADYSLDQIRVFEPGPVTENFDSYPDTHVGPGESFSTEHMSISLASDQPGSIALHQAREEDPGYAQRQILCLGHNTGNIYPPQTTRFDLPRVCQALTFDWADIRQPAQANAYDADGNLLASKDFNPGSNTLNAKVQLNAPRDSLISRFELTTRNRTSVDHFDFAAD
ncbi:hypothetical protein LOY37_01285 [Pseudomonas sp. B21-012]|uniref:hypothetical protein n=1 Tax=Pseudomonas sp. B21-012 TaxID=2895472 RepID=UPI00215FE59E|nr:hypothetical protein [Pseudomonas sp. B21-012]UVM56241.1 hypothetical protein LOY37_01285 [Pseudomonas sp. B21-012]